MLRRLVVEVGLDPHLERTDALSQRSCLFDQCAPMSPPTEPLVNLEFVEEDAGVAVDGTVSDATTFWRRAYVRWSICCVAELRRPPLSDQIEALPATSAPSASGEEASTSSH